MAKSAAKPAKNAARSAKSATASAQKRPSAAASPAAQAAPQAKAATAKRPSAARGQAPALTANVKATRGAEASTSQGRPAHAGKGTVAAASVGPVHAEFQVDLSVGPRSSDSRAARAQATDEVLSDVAERPASQPQAGDAPIALTPVIGLPPGGDAAASTTADTPGGPATASDGPAASGDASGNVAPAPRPTADALAREAGLAERAIRSPGTALRDAGRAVAEVLPLPLPARSFALPFGLLAALGAYLVAQRRFRPGSLPMSAAALPQQEGVRDRHRL
jgi:hypothetical protein